MKGKKFHNKLCNCQLLLDLSVPLRRKHCVQTGSGSHRAPFPVTPEAFCGLERPRQEADHSPPSSVKVKNAWSYTSSPSIRLYTVVLIYARR
jgi:hypothetical protein